MTHSATVSASLDRSAILLMSTHWKYGSLLCHISCPFASCLQQARARQKGPQGDASVHCTLSQPDSDEETQGTSSPCLHSLHQASVCRHIRVTRNTCNTPPMHTHTPVVGEHSPPLPPVETSTRLSNTPVSVCSQCIVQAGSPQTSLHTSLAQPLPVQIVKHQLQ